MRNFNYPYFSRDIAEFWRRWHISLSTWFRDYLYIPLGGSRGSKYKKVRNVFIIFIVSGFWHGANWTFITWGALNAIYFLPLLLTNRNRKNTDDVAKNSHLPSIKTIFQILVTFCLTTFAWIFFRAENMTIALDYIARMFSGQDGKNIGFNIFNAIIVIFLVLEWTSRKSESIQIQNKYLRYLFYIIIIHVILFYSTTNEPQNFIYFQF
jgi:alginate O-acetyltransferase complex protein AlgI